MHGRTFARSHDFAKLVNKKLANILIKRGILFMKRLFDIFNDYFGDLDYDDFARIKEEGLEVNCEVDESGTAYINIEIEHFKPERDPDEE